MDMTSLCEDIIRAQEERTSHIKQLKGQVESLRGNARRFLANSKKSREELSKALRKDLREGREDMIKNVNALREYFRVEQKEVRKVLDETNKIWNNMKQILAGKKTKSKKAG